MMLLINEYLKNSSNLYHTAATLSSTSLEFIPETVHEAERQDSDDVPLDDNELVLGTWMTKLLAPVSVNHLGPNVNNTVVKTDNPPMTGSYLTLASNILTWLSGTLSSNHPYLKVYTTTSLSPDLVHTLSALMK